MKTPLAQITDLHWRYSTGGSTWVLDNIGLTFLPGEKIGLVGRSGSGKSTLALTLNGIIPQCAAGAIMGQVEVCGMNTEQTPVPLLAAQVGMVLQSPDDQMTMNLVDHEVASGPANLRLPRAEIERRVRESLERLGLGALSGRETKSLSGGEKQKVAIAAALAMHPNLLVADEPTTDLDPASKEGVTGILRDLNSGMAILIISHDMEVVAGLAERLVVIDQGKIVADGTMDTIFSQPQILQQCGINLPQLVAFSHLMRVSEPDWPVTNNAAKVVSLLSGLPRPLPLQRGISPQGKVIARLDRVSFQYPDSKAFAVKDVSLEIREGEVIAILGNNGAGKTTLSKLLMGLLKPTSGQVLVLDEEVKRVRPDRVGYIYQNPDAMLCTSSVAEEVAFVLRNLHIANWQEKVRKTLEAVGLQGLEHRYPLALSKGQRQKLAFAAVAVAEPPILILDEPTTGVDGNSCQLIMCQVEALRQSGKGVICITHDMELAFRCADRIIVMRDGLIEAQGTPADIAQRGDRLRGSRLRPPVVSEISEKLGWPIAITPDELAQMATSVKEVVR